MEKNMLANLNQHARLLLKHPVWTIVSVLALGLGIGATATGLSVLRATVLHALPYKQPQELVILSERDPKRFGDRDLPVRAASYFQWREHSSSFQAILICDVGATTLTGAGEPERVNIAYVSWNTFDVLGIQPILGRGFTAKEDEPNNNDVVVISSGVWRGRFGSDPGVLGRTVKLNDKEHLIIGVMPDEFRFPEGYELVGFTGTPTAYRPEVWVPIALPSAQPSPRKSYNYSVIARLKPQVTVQEASTEMHVINSGLRDQYPGAYEDTDVSVIALEGFIVRATKPAANLLMMGGVFVLLMSCLNVGTMYIARITARRREMAIRLALGADFRHLFGEMLRESVLLCSLGGCVGVIIAIAGVRGISALAGRAIPRLDTAAVDWQVAILSILISVFIAITFALVSLWIVGKRGIADQLKQSGTAINETRHVGRLYSRGGLIATQTALSFILLVGFSLLAASYIKLMRVDPGFRTDRLLTFQIQSNLSRYKDPESWQLYFTKILDGLSAAPGIQSVAMIDNLPLTGEANISDTMLEGQPADFKLQAEHRRISAGYFDTLGIRLIDGRLFNGTDTQESQPVAIINRWMAEQYWPGQSPIGRRIQRENRPWRTVVGVVTDVRHSGIDKDPRPQVYVPYLQDPVPNMMFAARTEGNPLAFSDQVRANVWAVDKEQPVARLGTMQQHVLDSISRQRFLFYLLSFFGVTALVLTVTGVFGIVSYTVSRRMRELGIRMAIGATPASLFWLVVWEHMRHVVLGLAAGTLGAWLLADYLAGQLYKTSTADPLIYAITAACFSAVAFLALSFPARRAAKIDPLKILRSD